MHKHHLSLHLSLSLSITNLPNEFHTLHLVFSSHSCLPHTGTGMGGVQEEAGTPPDAMAMAQAGALAAVVVKGKRSKRRRVAVIAAGESSSAATEGSTSRSGADEAASGCVPEEEEEDMALCLMLLARGSPAQDAGSAVAVAKEAKFRSRRPVDGAAGEFVYECKTCNKCFSSFQALGGHRTSHKKPRLAPPLPLTTPSEDKKPAVVETTTAEDKPPPPPAQATTDPTVLAIPVIPKQEVDTNATTITIMRSSKQPRVHECSICGAEFASGQALGGHMRRHRPLVPTSVSAVDDGPRKEKSLLELDLNMPAPCDDGETSATSPPPAFAFAVKERSPLLFPASASALVDCHY